MLFLHLPARCLEKGETVGYSLDGRRRQTLCSGALSLHRRSRALMVDHRRSRRHRPYVASLCATHHALALGEIHDAFSTWASSPSSAPQTPGAAHAAHSHPADDAPRESATSNRASLSLTVRLWWASGRLHEPWASSAVLPGSVDAALSAVVLSWRTGPSTCALVTRGRRSFLHSTLYVDEQQ